MTVDRRLLDAVAMCLCWAEFGERGIADRPVDETPQSYWGRMAQKGRQRYYADAETLARFMMGDKALALVGAEPDDDVLASLLRGFGRASGLDLAGLRWRAALTAARESGIQESRRQMREEALRWVAAIHEGKDNSRDPPVVDNTCLRIRHAIAGLPDTPPPSAATQDKRAVFDKLHSNPNIMRPEDDWPHGYRHDKPEGE